MARKKQQQEAQGESADVGADGDAPTPPTPSSPADAATGMAALFAGLARAYGVYELMQRKVVGKAGGKKIVGKARTERGEVTLQMWEQHLRGKQGLGIVPIRDDATAVFGAIDVDRYNLSLPDVERKVAECGLPLLPTRTKSGGVHLYAFGAEPLPAALLKQRLEEWSVALGYGGAEVFPKQGALLSATDVGNWLNMPYFGALDGTTERYAVYKGQELTLEGFLARAQQIKITTEQLDALEPKEGDDFAEGPPCLQSLARTGFGEGQRNNGLFAVGVYLKKRYPDDWQAHLSAYNARFMKPPLGEAETKQLVKTLTRKDYNYTCDKAPLNSFCNRNLCRTRDFGVGRGSEDWGVVVDTDVLMVKTEPPYWIVTVNGTRMQLFSEHLMQQRLFIQMCVDNLRLMPAALPADKWRAEVNKILQNAQEVEAPPDAGAGGELEYHLKQFCTVFPQAETREEMVTGKPFTEDGVTHFRGADFKRYLDSVHFRALAGARLFAHLRKCGVTHKQYWVGEHNLYVWCVPQYEHKPVDVPPRSTRETGEM